MSHIYLFLMLNNSLRESGLWSCSSSSTKSLLLEVILHSLKTFLQLLAKKNNFRNPCCTEVLKFRVDLISASYHLLQGKSENKRPGQAEWTSSWLKKICNVFLSKIRIIKSWCNFTFFNSPFKRRERKIFQRRSNFLRYASLCCCFVSKWLEKIGQ